MAELNVYLVTVQGNVDSVHASTKSASGRASELKSNGQSGVKVELQELIGGSVVLEDTKPASKPKTKTKAIKTEDAEEADTPKANATAKKTKPVAEQRAANALKPKGRAEDEALPDNMRTLLTSSGDALSGQIVVVTGVPPVLGRKNAEKLVEAYGAKLSKSLSKKTNYVVVGNDAGPKKLEQIAELGIKTMDEDELVAMLEGSASNSTKRAADDGDDDKEEEEEEEEEKKKPARARKQRKEK
ncbi:putative replication factor C subunit 1 [Halenospora varia]|nr:putative replication factor C subunit 1 [Halenospora varia]